MGELDFARDTLLFVQLFSTMGVSHPWMFRMLIGRMYYAGHHLARRLLISEGLQPEAWRANVHQRVLDEVNQHFVLSGRMTREAWEALESLRDLRRRADYDLADPMRLRKVNSAFNLLTRFADECYKIAGVS